MPEIVEKEKIERYLYGGLTPAECEAFEERFFVDDDLFEEVQVAEMELIDRYVRKKMTAAERQKFEQSYLVTPERRAKVTETANFHRELTRLLAGDSTVDEREAVSWFERLFGGAFSSFGNARLAMTAAVLLLALGLGWFAYDGWRTRQELAATRDAQQKIQAELNEKLAGKEKEMQDRLAEQRGSDAEALSAMQEEIEQLRGKLDEAQRKARGANAIPPIQQTPTIATVILTGFRGGGGFATPVTLGKDTRVLNLQIPVNMTDGDAFDFTITRDSDKSVLLKSSGNKPRVTKSARFVSQSVATRDLSDGRYQVGIRNEKGAETTMRFVVTRK